MKLCLVEQGSTLSRIADGTMTVLGAGSITVPLRFVVSGTQTDGAVPVSIMTTSTHGQSQQLGDGVIHLQASAVPTAAQRVGAPVFATGNSVTAEVTPVSAAASTVQPVEQPVPAQQVGVGYVRVSAVPMNAQQAHQVTPQQVATTVPTMTAQHSAVPGIYQMAGLAPQFMPSVNPGTQSFYQHVTPQHCAHHNTVPTGIHVGNAFQQIRADALSKMPIPHNLRAHAISAAAEAYGTRGIAGVTDASLRQFMMSSDGRIQLHLNVPEAVERSARIAKFLDGVASGTVAPEIVKPTQTNEKSIGLQELIQTLRKRR